MLDPSTIQAVRDAARIVDFFPAGELKKAGREVKTLCFMHNDSRPSLRIDPRKNRFFCDVCRDGGDVLNLLQHRDGQTFTEAVLSIAERYRITPQYADDESAEKAQAAAAERQRLIQVNADAAQHWNQELIQNGPAEFWDYLADHGITEAVDEWQIGIGKASTWRRQLRLTVPLRDHLGKVVGFTARRLDWKKGDNDGKWINSPNSVLYQKSRHVFALDRVIRTARRYGEVVVVEGQLDAIACHINGLTNTVAIGGLGLTHDHVRQITQTTGVNRLVLALDGDAAGQKAQDRMLGELLPLLVKDQLDLRIVTIPDGMDAAEAGPDMVPLVADAPVWFEWWWDRAVGLVDMTDAPQVQLAHANIRRLLQALPDGVARDYIQQRSRTELKYTPRVKAKPLVQFTTPEDCYWYGRRALRCCLLNEECAGMAGQLQLQDVRLQAIQEAVLMVQALGFDWEKQCKWLPAIVESEMDQEAREEYRSLQFPMPEVLNSLKGRELEELTHSLDLLAEGCSSSDNDR